MKKTIIFDMDGVIVDSEPKYNQQIMELLQQKGKSISFDFLVTLFGTADDAGFVKIAQKAQVEETPAQLYQDYIEYRKANPIDFRSLLMPNCNDLLAQLKDRHYQLILASSSPLFVIDNVLDQTGLRSYFSHILSGEMFNESKPHPEIFLKAVELSGNQADECLVIEDSTMGILAANRANIDCLGLSNRLYTQDFSLATAVIDGLDEVIYYLENKI